MLATRSLDQDPLLAPQGPKVFARRLERRAKHGLQRHYFCQHWLSQLFELLKLCLADAGRILPQMELPESSLKLLIGDPDLPYPLKLIGAHGSGMDEGLAHYAHLEGPEADSRVVC